MEMFLANILLGIALGAAFGRVSVEIFRRSLSGGFLSGFYAGSGSALGDLTYLNLAAVGLLLLFNKPEIIFWLWIFGGLATSYLGVSGFFAPIDLGVKKVAAEEYNAFFAGLFVTITNPVSFFWWASIVGPQMVSTSQTIGSGLAYLYTLGMIVGLFIWWTVFSALTAHFRNKLTPFAIRIFSRGSSGILLGFSAWFFYNAFRIFQSW
jgi:threonine/homoserine/homoserine lactone efflux protein